MSLRPITYAPYQDRRACGRVHWQAGPVLICHDSRHEHMTKAEWASFKAWKAAPEKASYETVRLAGEIATMIRHFFGCRDLSPLKGVVTPPPSGHGRSDDTYPAARLAAEVAHELKWEARNVFKSDNLRKGRGRVVSLQEPDRAIFAHPEAGRLHLLVDDVTTTGRTLLRARLALSEVPHLAAVWLAYHGGLK